MKFLENLKVGARVSLGFAVMLIMMFLVYGFSVYSENKMEGYFKEIVHDNVEKLDLVHEMSESVHIVSRVMRTITLLHEDEAIRTELKKIDAARSEYDKFTEDLDKLPGSEKGLAIRKKIKDARDIARPLNSQVIELALAHKDAEAVNLLLTQAAPATEKWQAALDENISFQRDNNKKDTDTAEATSNRLFIISISTGLIAIVLGVSLAFALTRSVVNPLGVLISTVQKLAQGDDSARTKLQSKDELSDLGRAFDHMMDERVSSQTKIQKENEQLNNSVLGLLQAVAQLSRRDLTVKVPVTEDVTGPVADALNQLTGETAKVLQRVSDISTEVSNASLKVKTQSDSVVGVAETERQQVDKTAHELAAAAQAMNKIAQLAQTCNTAADNAIKTTQTALTTVNATVGGINVTRDTIRETEARIKRLGERSQEISGAVNLINNIAERTHILALNASMHAASAGEAGRGFAVVADEVQRLAESARQATEQIAGLVNNIQVETGDTVNTMNTAISQVVEGAKLAEQAGEQMKLTQETTAELVASVQQIASSSQQQAQVSNDLLKRAAEIRRSTQATSQQLAEQTKQTESLVEYAKNLISAVRVFKLPA